MKHSVPYTPQQNGVAERKNRALKEMETCMIETKDLNPNIWYESIKYDEYSQNIAPHKSVDVKTPYEAWFGHKPSVSHFRVFSSKDWATIPLEKRKSLQPQIKESIMVGYDEY